MSTALQRLPAPRRERLGRLAAEEFAAHGLEGASLNRILAAAGMSKSSFYHLLGSKQDLFDLALVDLAAAVGARLTVAAPEAFEGGQFWDKAERLFADLTGVLVNSSEALLLGRMVYSTLGQDVTAAAPVARIVDWVGQVLAVGRRSGQVRTDLPADLQFALVTAVLRTLDEWSVRHMEELPHEQLEELAGAQSALLRRMLAT